MSLKIALEEHFLSRAATATPSPNNAAFKAIPGLWEQSTELGPSRIADMDGGQITLQVISHGPGDLSPAACRETNDQLAEAVAAYPTRFAGFTELPMEEPVEVARELRRMCAPKSQEKRGVTFVGALVDSHTEDGLHYDGSEFDVLWYEATRLDVPVYIHPTRPTDNYRSSGNLPDDVATSTLAFGFGWRSDVAIHILRLYAAGVFDRFPRLKIIIEHMGEMIPHMLQRIERVLAWWGKNRSFREAWDNNIWITTSGNWALDPMACILRNTNHDQIMYSVDYPFAKGADALKWLEELEASGMVGEEVLERIRWRNAARLPRLDVTLT